MEEEIKCGKCGELQQQKFFEYHGKPLKLPWCIECRKNFPKEYHEAVNKLWRERTGITTSKKRREYVEKWQKEHPYKYKEYEINRRKREGLDHSPMPSPEQYTQATQVSENLGINHDTLLIWIRTGKIQAKIWRGKYFIENTSLGTVYALKDTQPSDKHKPISHAAADVGMSHQALQQHYAKGHISGIHTGRIIWIDPEKAKKELEERRKMNTPKRKDTDT